MNTRISNELSHDDSGEDRSERTSARHRRRSVRRRLITSIAALTATFGALTTVALTAHATGPVGDSADGGTGSGDLYANVQSPFGSETHLLRDDDLVLTLGNEESSAAGTQNDWISTVATQSSVGSECLYATCTQTFMEYDYEQPPAAGRFFNTAQDTIVQSPANFNSPPDFKMLSLNGSGGNYQFGFTQELPYGTNSTTTSLSAVADFNGDGYDDLLEVYSDYTQQFTGNGRARIMTAYNVNQPSAGFTVGPESALGFIYGARSVAVGDFNGDGRPDIAVLFIDSSNQPNVGIYSVDQNLNVTQQAMLVVADPIQQGLVDAPMQLAVGNFTGGTNQQLVLATVPSALGKMKVRVYDFTNSGNAYYPMEYGNVVTIPVNRMKLATGRFDWSSSTDSIAVLSTDVDNGNSTSQIDILTVDPSSETPAVVGTLSVAKDLYNTDNKNYLGLDIAIGNFDNVSSVPATDGGTTSQRDPNLQLAIATGYCQGTNGGRFQYQVKNLFFYDVNPAGPPTAVDGGPPPVLKQRSSLAMKTVDGGSGKVTRMAITAADLQGRSMRLGPGWRVAQDKTSPTMMLAQPPAHIDYVTNADGTSSLQNLTFSPGGFNAGYSTTNSSSSSNSQTYSHGWAMASEETLSESLRWGTKSDNITLSGSQSAMQDFSKRTDNTYGSMSSVTQNINLRTTTNDVVSYDDVTTYLYAYEVVGQTVCPEGETTCDDSAKVPMTVQFSATGSDQTHLAGADALPWYQPVWENGNLLSYPGNQQQLMLDVGNPAVVNNSDTLTTTPSSTALSTTWAGQQNESNTVDSAKEFTENADTSIGGTGTSPLPTPGQYKASLDVDLARSDSTDDLKTKTTSISESTTISLNAGAGFKNAYSYTPVVFGQNAPPNYFEPGDPNGSWATPVNANGLTVFGPMRTAFTVDPLSDPTNSAFWQHTYGPAAADGGAGAFDIALNHPTRWRNLNRSTSETVPDNCLPLGTGYMDCVSEKPRTPANPMGDAFHAMRGFFIYETAAANTATPASQGLQVDSATTGDSLTLEARVYNYSLNAMPSGTRVRVRFYGMPWNTSTDYPADYVSPSQPGGASFQIGEWDTTAIQPFNTSTSIPNFVLASVPFDTTNHTGTFVFWVVAWAEDSSGNMIQELPSKGLTGNPASTVDGGAAGTTFMDMTALEPTVANTWAEFSTDPATTSFSNNIGFFPGTLTILPPSLGAALGAPGAPAGNVRNLSVPALDLARSRVQQGEAAEVSATVHNAGSPMQRATVYFYDGDPARGGTIFGARRLPYVDGSADPTVRVQYAADTCGKHDIYVQVTHAGQAAPTTKALESIRVECDSPSPGGVDGGADGGAPSGDGGTNGGAEAGPGGGSPTDSDGGCSVAPGETSGGVSFLFPLGAVMASLWARGRRKTATPSRTTT